MISALENTTAYPVATAAGRGSGSYTTKRPHSDIAHPFVFIIPALCAIAFLNNGVIISVSIASKRFAKELFPSVRLLYGTLAILDISCVVAYQLIEWIDHVFGTGIKTNNQLGCQVVEWCAYATEAAAQWLLVWLFVTRLTSVTWPARAECLTSMRSTSIAIAAILLASALPSLFTFFVYDIDKEPHIARAFMAASVKKPVYSRPKLSHLSHLLTTEGGIDFSSFQSPSTEAYIMCSAREGVKNGRVALVLAGGTNFVLSTLILLGLSIALGWRLVLIGKTRERLTDRKRSQSLKETQEREMRRQSSLASVRIKLSRESRMAVTLLTISVVHLSIHVASVIDFVLIYTGYLLNFDHRTMNTLAAVEEVTDALNILIRLWNFYAYLLTIPSFRAALLQFITCHCLSKAPGSQRISLQEARTSRFSNGQPPPTASDREALVLQGAAAITRTENESTAIDKL